MDTWSDLKKRWKHPRRLWVYLRWRRKHARYYRFIEALDEIRLHSARIDKCLDYRDMVRREMERKRTDTSQRLHG